MRKLYICFIVISTVLLLTACGIPNLFRSDDSLEQGNLYFDEGKYEEAIKYYDKAIKENQFNATAYGNKSAALNLSDRNDEALVSVNKAIKLAPKMNSLNISKGDILTSLGRYKEAIACFDKAISIDDSYSEAFHKRGVTLYYQGNYEDALKDFDKAIKLDSSYADPYIWKASVYIELEKYEEALDASERGITRDRKSTFGYKVKAQILNRMGRYQEALDALDRAIGLNNNYEDAYIGKISIMYNQKNYEDCINLGLKALERFPKSEDINWFLGDAYSNIFKNEEAVSCYLKVLDINTQNDQAAANASREFFYLQDYDKAQMYANKALEINENNSDAIELNKELEKTRLPEAERIVDFVKNNYLYYGRIKDFDVVSKAFTEESYISMKDIEKYINTIRRKDDIFTFVISGKEYDYLTKEENINQVEGYELNDDVYCIRINVFTQTVGQEVKKTLNKIKSPQDKSLVIDLRGNTGGMIESSNEILDYLLPECSTSYTVDRNGYVNSYYSDADQIKFKKILVLVDQNSASSSELLTLGLKTYLDNVVVIGAPTFGKGVGQNIYEDKSRKYMIFLVSFYWNVREENITGSKIYPDVKINTNNIEDYSSAIKAQIN